MELEQGFDKRFGFRTLRSHNSDLPGEGLNARSGDLGISGFRVYGAVKLVFGIRAQAWDSLYQAPEA